MGKMLISGLVFTQPTVALPMLVLCEVGRLIRPCLRDDVDLTEILAGLAQP